MQLNKEQEEAVLHERGPMLVLAGPGSGKTYVLTNRILNLIEKAHVPPDNILVITFSKKAAKSMQHRFNALSNAFYPVTFGTFHAIFFHILTHHGLYSKEGILNTKTKISYIKQVGHILKINNAFELSWQNDMLTKISYYKNIQDAIFTNESPIPMDEEEQKEFRTVFDEYTKLCRNNRVLDFDDMVYECRKLLSSNEKIRAFWSERFQYILIDEFQDINAAQYDVVKLLLNDKNEKNIFVVGDDDQSIYGFRGATPGIMKKFINDFDGCKMVNLTVNYRSAYEIVSLADSSIRHNSDRIERKMQKTLKNRKRGYTYIEKFDTQEKEVCFIVDELKKYDPKDVAILFRSNHCIAMLEDKLRIEGIEYSKSAPQISFYELDMVRLVISYFKIACGKAGKEDFLRCINSPNRGISREAFNDGEYETDGKYCDGFAKMNRYYKEDMAEIFSSDCCDIVEEIENFKADCEMLCKLPAPAALNFLFLKLGVKKWIEDNYKIDFRYPLTCEELIFELKERFAGFATLEAIIELSESIIEKKDEEICNNNEKKHSSSVTLMSVHASKGLEFPVVFVVGLQDGLFPHHKYLNSQSQIEEERRLFYVAMTRAKDVLYLCGHGTEHGKRLSRFIDELS